MTESAGSARNADSSAERRAPGAWRRIDATAAVVLLPGIALCLLYAPALDYGYAWTDTSSIAGRTLLRPAGELALAFREPLHRIPHRGAAAQQGYYRPLQVVALSWVDQTFGGSPRHFRSVGLLFGALSLGIFAVFARRLLGSAPLALLAALFVACHPAGIETLVWISAASGPMSAAFIAAALALGLASVRAGSLPKFVALGLASLAALVGGLLSKELAVVEPALLLVAILAAARGDGQPAPSSRSRALAGGLFVLHAATVAVYTFLWRPVVLGNALATLPPIGGSWSSQLATAVANWPARLAWLFVPLASTTSDVVRVVASPADPGALLGAALALLSLVAFGWCLRRGRPITALGLAWIWIAYAPSAGLVPQLHANGERYLALSSFGAALIVADLLGVSARRAGRGFAVGAAVLWLAFLGQRTHARIPAWSSNLGLFQAEIARDPAYREGHYLVAVELFELGRVDEADATLQPLLRAAPQFAGTASYANPLAVNELACGIAFSLRRYSEVLALEDRLRRENPGVVQAAPLRTCIGQANNALGNTRRAVELFTGVADELGATTPPPLYIMLARGNLRLGETEACRKWLERARAVVSRDPSLAPKIREIETALQRATRPPEPPAAP